MNDLLLVPAFARLDDYLGMWSMVPEHFMSIWDMATRMNMRQHVEEGAEGLRSAIEKLPTASGKNLAVVRLSGLLMKSQSSLGGTSTIQARRDIRQAAADPEVSGILMLIDSPGGTVAGTHDLATDVKAAAKSKPVWAHIDDTGASAAYWIASQADKITVNSPTALVGSIGTFQVVNDISAAAEKAGVRTLLFSTGPMKGMGTPGTKITDEQAAHYQHLVDSAQQSFDAAVQKGRKFSAKEMATIRSGAVYTANQAMDMGLVDAVQPLGKTLSEMTDMMRKNHGRDMRSEIDLLAFTHNSETSANEPDWGGVDKTALPRMAFADQGEPDSKSTWGYPHHWVQNAGGKDENGIWTTGTLLLHRGGLNAAWSAAMGGRSGQKAPQAVIDHLQAHRRALGLETPSNAVAGMPPTRRRMPPRLNS